MSAPRPSVDTEDWRGRDGVPRAVITRAGRWTYRIVIHDGISAYGPTFMGVQVGWTVYGFRRAQRRARRELARYLRQAEPQRWEITG